MIIKLYTPLAIHELGKRDNQEDNIYPAMGNATHEDCLFIVCDGMGGHEHGEVASSTFANALARFFEGRVSPDVVLTDQTLADAVEFAYSQLDAVDDGNLKKMGTTLTLLYFHRGGVTAAHIGDSRIYHIRHGKGMLYVSRDHSLVFDLFQSGEITYDEMRTHSSKNVITRAVQPGKENRVKPDIIHITDVQPGDYFYMCSDGMLEQMEDDELVQLLTATGGDEKKRQQLIAATADNSDNHSAYLIHVESVTREDSDAALVVTNEEKTSRCNALNIMPINGKRSQEEDVKMVPPPDTSTSTAYKPKSGFKKWLPLLLLVMLVIAAGVFFNIRDKGKTQNMSKEVPEAVLDGDTSSSGISPIKRNHHDTDKVLNAKPKPSAASATTPGAKPTLKPSDNTERKFDTKGIEKIIPQEHQKPTERKDDTNEKTEKEPDYHNG